MLTDLRTVLEAIITNPDATVGSVLAGSLRQRVVKQL